ncbi:bifunctional 2-keto-4-hydroxyglutarate aldolase/2-keto-3-deoxy-6-phosphogluconate aldolase [Laceyella putida]|uniref:Bifunctional 2-keto-4-hydroxyglutarate aldolase/2-keto-3-deoxy-6-phosphogluconate aldolase n=1 Tax=Laceyella putida TaxID=110101 RepID=A0ABW2RMP0_9BACL
MDKYRVIERVTTEKLVAVIRAKSEAEGLAYVQEAIAGGIKFIEVTMTTPGALELIKQLSTTYRENEEIVIGVGTVLDETTARLAMLAGARFVVTPYLDEEVIRLCNLYKIPVMPGVMTVKDAALALEAGCDIVKLFPGQVFGPDMIKALKGPLPQLHVMPTGGVGLGNLREWIAAGAVAVGIGGDLTKEAERTGDAGKVRRKAEEYVRALADVSGG